MEDVVDILLTTYNTNINYLKQQLDSILKQTYTNFNLIILYFQQKNLGCTKSFEFLLEKSTSKYIAFSDHDDIWYPNKIEESLKKIKEKNVDLVYCDANQVDEEGRVLHNSYLNYKNMPKVSR